MLTLEELEDNLQEKDEQQKGVEEELSNLFDNAGFTRVDKPNNFSFESHVKDAKALFTVDNSTYNYTAYISTEGTNSFNYSVKGNIDGATDAALKFIEQWANFADGIEFTDDEIESE